MEQIETDNLLTKDMENPNSKNNPRDPRLA